MSEQTYKTTHENITKDMELLYSEKNPFRRWIALQLFDEFLESENSHSLSTADGVLY